MRDGTSEIRRVVIATDLVAQSVDLFAHGLAMALSARAELFLVHVDDPLHPESGWRQLPTVRELLVRWGRLSPSATPMEFEALGIRVHPLDYRPTERDVAVAVARRVADLAPDLLILGTHER